MAKQKGKKKEERGSGSVESQKILLLRIKAYDEAVRYSTLFTLFIVIFFVFFTSSLTELYYFFSLFGLTAFTCSVITRVLLIVCSI